MWLNVESKRPSRMMRVASYKAAILCVCLGFAGAAPAMARGGFVHGMGGLRGHAGARMGQAGLETPVYVLITVSSISNADAFKSTMDNLVAAVATFNGRLVVDVDKPASWEGRSAEHLVMIRFDTPDEAQAWKNSDAFKSFDAALHQSSSSNMQLVQGLPMPIDHGGRRGRGGRFDAKAFEPNVEDYNQLLNRKLHSICKGC